MPHRPNELEHRYGDHVHILQDPLANTLLAKLCSDDTQQPEVNRLVSALYRDLVATVISNELPSVNVERSTRMTAQHPNAIWRGSIIDPAARVAVVCVARAGIFPSQVTYDFLNELLDPKGVRQDHMLMNRVTDEAGHIAGAAIQGAKIGGSVEGTTLLVPDPMGATGTTLVTLIDHYRKNVPGTPASAIAVNLIITPEYIRKIKEESPGTLIYAYRVDRGLSEADVLASVPGEHWDRERGLSDEGYIIPGGGGLGEVMNNAFV